MCEAALRKMTAFESVAAAAGTTRRSAKNPVLMDLPSQLILTTTLFKTYSLRFCSDIKWARRLDCPAPATLTFSSSGRRFGFGYMG